MLALFQILDLYHVAMSFTSLSKRSILSNKLKRVIGELISSNHNAFLKGRQISDCTLLGHEFNRDFKKKLRKRACLKIYLQKAFDTVIYYMMHCLKFPHKWICCIKECSSTSTLTRRPPLPLYLYNGDGILDYQDGFVCKVSWNSFISSFTWNLDTTCHWWTNWDLELRVGKQAHSLLQEN